MNQPVQEVPKRATTQIAVNIPNQTKNQAIPLLDKINNHIESLVRGKDLLSIDKSIRSIKSHLSSDVREAKNVYFIIRSIPLIATLIPNSPLETEFKRAVEEKKIQEVDLQDRK